MTSRAGRPVSPDPAELPTAIMFIHSVYFWLRDDLADDERANFVAGLRSLTRIGGVRHGWIGTPASTDRPVIDRSWSWSLTLVFADQRAHDAYQVDPAHDRFRDDCSKYWKSVRIHDTVTA